MKSFNQYILEKLKLSKASHKKIELVDLDLPSGNLWAAYNLGVDFNKYEKDLVPNWFGNYYAWGETETKDSYTWKTYIHCKGSENDLIKYCSERCNSTWNGEGEPDNKLELDDEDNVVIEELGYGYDIPNDADALELEKVPHEWVENYQDFEGLNGMLFKAKNGNELFFPSAGLMFEEDNIDLEKAGIWLKQCDEYSSDSGDILYMHNNDEAVVSTLWKLNGVPVRAIKRG